MDSKPPKQPEPPQKTARIEKLADATKPTLTFQVTVPPARAGLIAVMEWRVIKLADPNKNRKETAVMILGMWTSSTRGFCSTDQVAILS